MGIYGSTQCLRESQMSIDLYNKYMADWQTTDFYTYNPSGMQYEEYVKGREDGSIPAPDPAVERYNITHPIGYDGYDYLETHH